MSLYKLSLSDNIFAACIVPDTQGTLPKDEALIKLSAHLLTLARQAESLAVRYLSQVSDKYVVEENDE